jgi:hypothetical protein
VRRFGFGQWWTLVQRNLVLKSRDQGQIWSMFLQALLIPLLIAVIFQRLELPTEELGPEEWTRFCGRVSTVHFFLVVSAVWFGCSNAARDIVGEMAIFQRERMVSLKLPSYVFSKSFVLLLISLLQCLLLLGIVYIGCGLQVPFAQTYFMLVLASQVGAAMGLAISGLVRTTDTAVSLLPIPLLVMILLGGGMKPLHEMPAAGQALSYVFPARWAFEVNVTAEADKRDKCPLPGMGDRDTAENAFPQLPDKKGKERSRHSTGECVAWLVGIWSALSGFVLVVLKRRDIH